MAASAPARYRLELCGVGAVDLPAAAALAAAHGRVEPAEPAADLPAHLGADAYVQARTQLLAAVSAGPPRQQAVAWMIDADPPAAMSPNAVVTALTALARGSRDPVIWRWATERCASDQGCVARLAREWAEVDAGNAMPWLHLLDADPKAVQHAWRGLAQATRFQSYHGALTAAAMQAWPAHLPAYLSGMLWVETTGVEAALSWPGLTAVARACGTAVEANPERARCDALTHALVHGSDNLLGFGVGVRMAERAGWPQEQLAPLRAERARLQRGARAPWSDAQPLSCASVERLSAYALQLAQHGELAIARRQADERAARERR